MAEEGGRNFRSRKFRAELKTEVPKWEAEGIIDHEAATTLRTRYALDEDGIGVATIAVYILGCLLIGGGIISLVAWNWESLPKAIKLILITGAMLAANGVGYYFWKINGERERLGHALLLLGTLIFGANIGLVAQIFHVSSHWYNGVGAWAFGALLMAWVVRSIPIACLSLFIGVVWSFGYIEDHSKIFPFIPYLLLAAYLPLAWVKRSQILFALAVVAATVSASFLAGEQSDEVVAVFQTVIAFSFLLTALPLAFGDGRTDPWFGRSAKILGLIGFVGAIYLASFMEVAEELDIYEMSSRTALGWLWIVIPVFGASLLLTAKRALTGPRFRGAELTALAVAGGAVATGLATLFDDLHIVMAVLANLVLAALVASSIYRSIHRLERSSFWFGVLLAGLVIVSRFLEFETGLLLKGTVFTVCGIIVMAVGLGFEKRLQAERKRHVEAA